MSNEIKNINENIKSEELISPFKVRLPQQKFSNLLLKMESNLKEILIDENLNEETNDDQYFSIDSTPLYSYPSEHSSLYEISDFEL
jgi:hypothetical protein